MKLALFGRYIDKVWNEKLASLFSLLSSRGFSFCYHHDFFNFLRQNSSVEIPEGDLFMGYEDFPSDCDLLLSLGGDGTLLDSLTIVRDRKVPVAGINFGRLGFLTSAKVNCTDNQWVDMLLNRDFHLEQRPLLKLRSEEVAGGIYPYAMNEITIQRDGPVMIGVDVAINGKRVTTYWADGLLVATSTGSTAYSLSLGGPIIVPNSNVLILSPIASHNLNMRPLIIPDNSCIDISIQAKSDNAILTIDNRSVKISTKSHISISKGDYSLNTISFSNSGFFQALNEKLLWGEDKRNISEDGQ